MARKYEVRDIDGSNARQMTVAEYRSEVDASKKAAIAKFTADSMKIDGGRLAELLARRK